MNNITEHYVKAFYRLNVNRARGRVSPHKPVMLLTIIELVESGLLKENKIYYNPRLLEIFRAYFQAVQKPGDACNPYFPFFHLKSEKFWHLQPLPGKDNVLKAMHTVRGPTDITGNIAYVYLDDDLLAH